MSEDAPRLCACQIQTSGFSHVADGVAAVRKAAREELRRRRALVQARVQHEQHAISAPHLCQRTAHAFLLDDVAALAQARRVDDVHRHAFAVDALAQHVAAVGLRVTEAHLEQR